MESEHSEESIEFLKTILATSPDLIGVITKDGIFKYVNKVVEGLKLSDVVGTSVFSFSAKDEVEPLKGYMEKAFRENTTVRYETHAVGPNNTQVVYACSISPFTYNNERLLVSIGTDISAQKKIERELEEKVKQLEVLNAAMVNREIKMIELKKKLEELGHKE